MNNAGISDDGPLEEQTLAELTEVIDVNLVAVLDLCRVLAPLLFARLATGIAKRWLRSGAREERVSSVRSISGRIREQWSSAAKSRPIRPTD